MSACPRRTVAAVDFDAREGIGSPPWWEGALATLLLAIAMVAWLVPLGGLSLGWDTLNHHVYLGWMAVKGDRLQHDVFAAGSMSCQYPYAYAPLYWLQANQASGTQAALVLAVPSLGAVPAVWLLAWALYPRRTLEARAARLAWTAVAFLSPLWWSLLDSTSNDALSALPMVWAYALAAWRIAVACSAPIQIQRRRDREDIAWYFAVGMLAALALVIKISQAFAAVGLLVLTVAGATGFRQAMERVCAMTAGGCVIAVVLWWPWARKVWAACGSPIYPMLTDVLRPVGGALP